MLLLRSQWKVEASEARQVYVIVVEKFMHHNVVVSITLMSLTH